MREIVHIQAGQCGNQIGAKVSPRNRDGSNFISPEKEKKKQENNRIPSFVFKFLFVCVRKKCFNENLVQISFFSQKNFQIFKFSFKSFQL